MEGKPAYDWRGEDWSKPKGVGTGAGTGAGIGFAGQSGIRGPDGGSNWEKGRR